MENNQQRSLKIKQLILELAQNGNATSDKVSRRIGIAMNTAAQWLSQMAEERVIELAEIRNSRKYYRIARMDNYGAHDPFGLAAKSSKRLLNVYDPIGALFKRVPRRKAKKQTRKGTNNFTNDEGSGKALALGDRNLSVKEYGKPTELRDII
jgi:hypothetical protein